MRILDVGCGTGQLLVEMNRRCPDAELFGVDLSPGMVDAARKHLGSLQISAEIKQADSADLRFLEGARFDLVTCTHSFHHYPEKSQVIGAFARILAPGGSVMILDGDPTTAWGYLLFERLVAWFEGPIHHCSAEEMHQLLSDKGFANIQQYRGFPCSPVLLTVGQCR